MQNILLGVGCPDWSREDGKWGPSSSAQFAAFLRKTGQTKIYAAMKQPSMAAIKRQLFKDWVAQNDFIATLRTDAKYCEPSAQDVKLMVDLTYRNEETELPDGLPEAIAKEMQRLLMSVGCPDWRGDDGRWGASSSTQFAEFLRKTGQEEAYEAVKNTTVIRIKALFDKWRPQNDFISTLNTDVTYCYPLPFGGEDAVDNQNQYRF